MSLQRVALFAFGSRGDMQPIFALAAYLQRARNIRVLVFCPENNEAFCASLGLECVSIWPRIDFAEDDGCPPEIADLNAKARAATAAGDAGGLFQVIARIRALGVPTGVPAVLAAMRAFGADLILAGPLDSNLADAVSLALRVPVVICCLQLSALSSQITSMLGERRMHYLSWLIVFLVINKTVDATEAPLLRAAFGRALPADHLLLGDCSFARCLSEWSHPIAPILVAASAHVSPKPTDLVPDYARRIELTGAWVLDEEHQMQLSSTVQGPAGSALFGGGGAVDALRTFLAQPGPQPVYMGWGSMVAGSAARMVLLAVRALKLASQRGIILGGAARLSLSMLESAGDDDACELQAYAKAHVLIVESAPHEWLLPQCAVIVHHGGAGTTAAAMRAGTPSVVTPMFVDQFNNAQLTANAKVGVAMPQFTNVTPEALAAAIGTCLQPGMQAAAAALGSTLRAEDGLSRASDALVSFHQEEVCTGVFAAAFEARLAQRARYRKRSLLRGGLLGGLHSAVIVLSLLVGIAKAP